jgi:glycine cleavage system H protein
MSYIVLACTGLDKPEGSVTREIALRLAEDAGAEIVCPVALNRTPARYRKALADKKVIVVDGCATQCAGRLAATAGVKPVHKIVVSQVLKESGKTLPPELRLAPENLELAHKIALEIELAQGSAPAAEAASAAQAGVTQTASPTARAATAPAEFRPPSDFIVVVYDKYEFRVPLTGYLFNANDVWVQVTGNRARIGITDYMQQRLTDITYVQPASVGTSIEQFGEAGTVESTKATFEIVSPVAGTVVATNEAVTEAPESINEDPYSSWLVEVELSAWEGDRDLLVDGPAYAAEVERKAAED